MEIFNLADKDLGKLNKPELIEYIKKLKIGTTDLLNNFMADMKKEIASVNNKLEHMSRENTELKNLITNNRDLKGKIKEMEVQTYDSVQYVRRNNIEISGIPEIFNDNLEDKVIEICNAFDVVVKKDEIEACHRLPRKRNSKFPATTIVRFVNRRKVESLIDNKKKVVDLSPLGFESNSKLFFSENLCPYYRTLFYHCRKLKLLGQVKYAWSRNGTVKIRRDDSSPIIKMCHIDDIAENFPEYNLSI